MSTVITPALVLHGADYLESSRIFRLLTRDAGVLSVIARGARNSGKRFGKALDLFAGGTAEIQTRPGRDMQTLTGFDVQRSHVALAMDPARFAGAAAIAETVLRCVLDDPAPAVHDLIEETLGRLERSAAEEVDSQVLRSLWRLLALTGSAPAVDECVMCGRTLAPGADSLFSHAAGGVLCAGCAVRARGARRLPAAALDALRSWLEDRPHIAADAATVRAHQRLFREFLGYHAGDAREPRAYLLWEEGKLASRNPLPSTRV